MKISTLWYCGSPLSDNDMIVTAEKSYKDQVESRNLKNPSNLLNISLYKYLLIYKYSIQFHHSFQVFPYEIETYIHNISIYI